MCPHRSWSRSNADPLHPLIKYFDARQDAAFWRRVRRRSRQALCSGALQPIDTRACCVDDRGIAFIVRVSDNLARKQAAPSAYRRPSDPDPFAHPEPDLIVGPAGPRHVALLNKFNVIDHHVLVVTREPEHQESPLGAADFAALAAGVAGGAGLAFYNAGRTAGASQPHKHLQLVPLPLSHRAALPVARLLHGARSGLNSIPGLPFRHFLQWLDADPAAPAAFGEACHDAYIEGLGALDLIKPDGTGAGTADAYPRPYNLLLTDQWLLIVPRCAERYGPIGVNGLGYAGSLFVGSREALEQVRAAGPMTILAGVSVARP